jgi:alpha-galactosidase
VLNKFDKEFPHWKGRGYEIAGFVWWQGHKDGGEPHASRYEKNLVHLIKTLRKEFDAPKAPFVIATIGFGGWKMSGPHKTVAEAQLAVSGNKGKYPDFKGNVQTVETRGFWREPEVSPRNQGFHYNQNAETYMLVGEALGKGMLKFLKAHE